MGKRAAFLVCVILLLGVFATAAKAELIAYYPFDEGSGTTAADASGNGNDGTFDGNVEWVEGHVGMAVRLDTAGERVVLNSLDPTAANNAMTLAAWIKWEGSDHSITHQGIFGKRQGWDPRTNVKWFWEAQPDGDLAFRNGDAAVTASGVLDAHANEWAHVALTWDDGAVVQYINGEEVNTGNMTFRDTADDTVMTVGCVSATNSETFVGSLDEARIYDTVLSVDELMRAMAGTAPDIASLPEPQDGALVGETWVALGWEPGAYAVTHDVYFGTSFDDVNEAAEGTFLGNTAETRMVVGVAGKPVPEGLVPGTTYYWRVDEVNDANALSPWRGDVWSFFVPPKTAYEPTPADGIPYVMPNAQLSWSPGLKAFMRSVYIGTDANEVAGASGGPVQVETTYSTGELELGTTYYWRVDEFDGMWHESPVWSFTTVPDIEVQDPDLMAWWKLDEAAGTTAVDWSGHGNHGLLVGPEWMVPGWIGQAALDFSESGAGSYVAIDNLVYDTNDMTAVSVCAWVRTSNAGTQYIVSADRNEYYRLEIAGSGGGPGQVGWDVMTDTGQVDYGSVTRVDDGQWHHVTGVFDNGTLTIYIDGIAEPSATGGPLMGTANPRYVFIGANSEATEFNGNRGGGDPVDGGVDDVRIYHKALTAAEIAEVMRGDPLMAWDFQPANGRTVDIREITSLSWAAGDLADEHDVYLGTDVNDVLMADTSDATGVYRGRQAGTTFTPAGGFEWGQTHYWRIDEVNTDGTITEGGVRTFTVADFLPVENFEAYDDIQEEGGNPVFLAWIDGFGDDGNGSVVGYIDPANGTFNETSNVYEGGQAMPFAYDNTTAPVSEAFYEFSPTDDWSGYGVTDLSLWVHGQAAGFTELGDDGVSMSGGGSDIWNTADEFRYVYKTLNGDGSMTALVTGVGAGTNAWAKGGVMIRQNLEPGAVNALIAVTGGNGNGGTFQWRPVADADSDSSRTLSGIEAPYWVRLVREGNTFTGYMSADGETWEQQGTASIDLEMTDPVLIGLAVTSHEATELRGYSFDNISSTGNVTGAWQVEDVGIFAPLEGGNDPADLYVTVEDSAGGSATIEHPDPEVILTPAWQNWRIPLDSLAGVNLSRIDRMTVGVSGSGSTGMLLFDDIKVVRPAPVDEATEADMP